MKWHILSLPFTGSQKTHSLSIPFHQYLFSFFILSHLNLTKVPNSHLHCLIYLLLFQILGLIITSLYFVLYFTFLILHVYVFVYPFFFSLFFNYFSKFLSSLPRFFIWHWNIKIKTTTSPRDSRERKVRYSMSTRSREDIRVPTYPHYILRLHMFRMCAMHSFHAGGALVAISSSHS